MSCSPKFFSQESSSSQEEGELSNELAQTSVDDIISSFRNKNNISNINELSEKTSPSLDMEKLLKSPCLPLLVDMLPPSLLYNTLKIEGISSCLEIIAHIKGPTLVKIMDYGLWAYDKNLQTHEITVDVFLDWLEAWLAIGSKFTFDRIIDLGEEAVVSIFSKLFEIKVVGVSKIDENIEENWYLTEDKSFYIQIPSDYETRSETLTTLIKELYAVDGKKAKGIFSYVSMLIRAESLEEAIKLRDIRLEEQGILSHLDSLHLLKRQDESYFFNAIKAKIQNWRELKAQDTLALPLSEAQNISLEREEENQELVIKYFQSLENKKAFKVLNSIFSAQSKKSLLPWKGDNKISNPEDFIDENYIREISKGVLTESQKTLNELLFNKEQREKGKTQSEILLFEELIRALSLKSPDKALFLKSSLCELANGFLSYMNNSLQDLNLNYYLSVVKSFLNLGLETTLEKSSEFGLNVLFDEDKITDSKISQAQLTLELLGVEFIFKLAWNVLQNTMLKFLRKVDTILISLDDKNLKRLLESQSKTTLSFEALYFKRNFVTVNKSLLLLKEYLSNESFVLMDKLIRKVPLFPSYVLEERSLNISQSSQFFSKVEQIKSLESLTHKINKSFFEV